MAGLRSLLAVSRIAVRRAAGELLRPVRRYVRRAMSRRTAQLGTPAGAPIHLEVDQFVAVIGFVHLRGRLIHATQPVDEVVLQVDGKPMAKARPDAAHAFEIHAKLGGPDFKMRNPSLLVIQADGTQVVIQHPAGFPNLDGIGGLLYGRFLDRVANLAPGNFLEIGARARSGVVRKGHIPDTWTYVGLDVVAGENVDVVGDAHELSTLLPNHHFQAVSALAVFEHLAMPWKAAIELNKVMAMGAIGYALAPQTFPQHDEPWDYFRFSEWSWPSLFNEQTGFRIIEAGSADPAYVVAKFWHEARDHYPSRGMALSAVIFEKIGDTKLTWPVSLSEVDNTNYSY